MGMDWRSDQPCPLDSYFGFIKNIFIVKGQPFQVGFFIIIYF
jgi:hypothetical protein